MIRVAHLVLCLLSGCWLASAAPLLPTVRTPRSGQNGRLSSTSSTSSSSSSSSSSKSAAPRQQLRPASGCEEALARKTVVIFPGPEVPYLGSLPNFMPNHGIDIDPEDTSLLALSDPKQASCAQSIGDIADTLVIWEDGNLPSYQRVRGLSVYDLDALQDLKGLDNLKMVTGDLIISENMMLRSLKGLEQLQRVGGDLIMNSNMNLKTVDGLQGLTSIGGQFLLKGNGQLRTLDAMTSLQSIGQFATLINNGNHNMLLPRGVAVGPEGEAEVAADLASEGPGGYDGAVLIIHGDAGPPSIADVSGTAFTYMPPLPNFDVTPRNVRFAPSGKAVSTNEGGVLRGHVVIWDDGTLQSLSSTLYHVTEVTGTLAYLGGVAISSDLDQAGLKDFWGLDSLKSVGALGIVGGSQLKNLEGMLYLTEIKGSLTVAFCPRIKSLKGLGPEVATVAATSVLANFMSARTMGRRLAQTKSGGLQKIGSEVWIVSNPELKDLTGLEGVEEVNWRMTISNNMKLESLAALASLRRVGGGLVVLDNPSLSSTSGLASLQDVGLHAHFFWNIGLKDVEGLSKLKAVKGDVAIVASPMVTDLAPLSGLSSIGMNLVLSRLGIKDLNGLGSLSSVGGLVDVSENWDLVSLNGLNSLVKVGDAVHLINNPVLSSLGPLTRTLRVANAGIYTEDNHNLSVPGGWAAGFVKEFPLPAPAPPPSVPESTLADSARAIKEHASSAAIANPVAPRDSAYGAVPGALGGKPDS
ncbi:hypothetical protein DUNSADRAFT_15282 [Dunaliella salina]|uniref:Receptor L-domain domain-containing protein n=1 Tax=Dunaliella salina TaxID=3046 RepID=A0ABQ7G5R9_DUNSA|nr:hypothetical protein DUNSADRAFT_15282 [Dunaliella salina]|eukprot:KAF5829945.1 hypothetical protein DUNSADRAFT_15282 [Dunaliella salina]